SAPLNRSIETPDSSPGAALPVAETTTVSVATANVNVTVTCVWFEMDPHCSANPGARTCTRMSAAYRSWNCATPCASVMEIAVARPEFCEKTSTCAPDTAADCGSVTFTVKSEAKAERERKTMAKNRQLRITPPFLAKGVGVGVRAGLLAHE